MEVNVGEIWIRKTNNTRVKIIRIVGALDGKLYNRSDIQYESYPSGTKSQIYYENFRYRYRIDDGKEYKVPTVKIPEIKFGSAGGNGSVTFRHSKSAARFGMRYGTGGLVTFSDNTVDDMITYLQYYRQLRIDEGTWTGGDSESA